MIRADRDTQEDTRAGYAYSLLESSGYTEPWKYEISQEIGAGSADQVELIIQDLLMNQVDKWNSFTNKSINYRINQHDL